MMSKLFDKTFWKFIIVGIINTIFGTTVMFVSYNILQFSYWISSALNYILGSILSYFLNKNFTFQNKEKSWRVVVRFVINISLCYLIAYGAAKPFAMWVLSDSSISIQENAAMLIGMCVFVILNYFGQKMFVFRCSK